MIGYRKFTVAMTYLVASIVLLVLGYIPGQGFVSDISPAFIAFFGSNLVEHIKDRVKEKVEELKK